MSEVERFDAYYGYPSCRATGRHIHANGEFVLASDYDALKEYTDQIESAESLCADVYESLKAERDALAAELEAVKAENRAIANRFGDGLKRANSFNPNEPLGKVIDRCVMALVNLDDLKREHALVRDINCFLNDELARVKAESLRVVRIDDECADVWYMTPNGLGWFSKDAKGEPCIETPTSYERDDTNCYPVRLERWEAEE